MFLFVLFRNEEIAVQVRDNDRIRDDSGERTTRKTILQNLEPEGKFLLIWNVMFIVSCMIAVSLDPLFFYIPVTNEDNKCVRLDKKLRATAIVLRSMTDIIHIVHMILQFRTGFIDKASRKFGKPVLVKDARKIARRYFWPYFVIDILAILPIPQVHKEDLLFLII